MANVHNFPKTSRDFQIRVNSLYVPGVTELDVDGMTGPKTKAAIKAAMNHLGYTHSEDLFDSSGMTRVHWHWTAGADGISSFARKHYNDLFDSEGNHYDGITPAQQQAFYSPGRVGVSHTLNANTGAAGLSVTAMANASTRGNVVDAGNHPITWEGIDAMLERTAEYCRTWDIKPSPWTTLSHAEVQGNIGIRQRGKWDIRVLPDDLSSLRNAREVGDVLRKRLVERFM